jgi:flagellar hook-associated protein 2
MVDTNILNTLGAGSGLDTIAMVDAIVAAEKSPKETLLNSKIELSEAKISGLGALKSSLGTLQSSFDTLADPEFFKANISVDANTYAFTTSPSEGAEPGVYSVTVQQLAAPQREVSEGFGSVDVDLNNGSPLMVNIQVGDDPEFGVYASPPTPQGIADAISNAGSGLSARVVDTGEGDTPFIILITGQEGSDNAFEVSVNGMNWSTVNEALDSKLTVDGVQLTRQSNQISDAITGVDLDLLMTQAMPVSVVVERDLQPIEDAIVELVDLYNSFLEVTNILGDESLFDADGSGSLAADSTLRFVKQAIRRSMTDLVGSGSIANISDLGLTANLDGTIDIDSERLAAVLQSSEVDVAAFFSGLGANTDNVDGFAGAVSSRIGQIIEDGGIIDGKIDTAENSVDRFQEQLEKLEMRMEAVRARYMMQFTAMEQAVDQFNSLKDSLKTQFENMPFTNKN